MECTEMDKNDDQNYEIQIQVVINQIYHLRDNIGFLSSDTADF